MNFIYAQMSSTVQKMAAPNAASVPDSSAQSESLQHKAGMANAAAQRAEAPRPNNTGLPDNLKSGIESLSGFSMDDVRVHYNSSKPATVQALAYTQGTDIHVAPGQEKCLPHEAWHVAQQMAGRVSPTTNINGMPVNDNAALEHEADVMGEKAVQCKVLNKKIKRTTCFRNDAVQCYYLNREGEKRTFETLNDLVSFIERINSQNGSEKIKTKFKLSCSDGGENNLLYIESQIKVFVEEWRSKGLDLKNLFDMEISEYKDFNSIIMLVYRLMKEHETVDSGTFYKIGISAGERNLKNYPSVRAFETFVNQNDLSPDYFTTTRIERIDGVAVKFHPTNETGKYSVKVYADYNEKLNSTIKRALYVVDDRFLNFQPSIYDGH